MELTAELISAISGGILAVGGALAKLMHWGVNVARDEARLTRESHEKQTQALIESQKERDALQIQLAQQREETVERRFASLTDSFRQGLDDVRRSQEIVVAMHQDYKAKEAKDTQG